MTCLEINFWDYSIWNVLVQLAIILVSIVLGHIIRRKVPFIKNSLLPSSVIGGIIIFSLRFIPQVHEFIDADFMQALTYHALGLGFVALTLKSGIKTKDKNKLIVMDSGIITVNGYLLQGICGLGITLVLAVTFMKELFPASGLLLPMGFGQGTGQALNIGKAYESLGFKNGSGFGLAIAAIGFIVACLVGVLYLNILRRKHKLTVQEERIAKNNLMDENIYEENEAPLNESVDKFTLQVAFVLIVYILTYLVILGLSKICDLYLGDFGVKTLKPLFWGFNFLFGSIFALLFKKLLGGLRKTSFVNHQYINSYMMNRISGFFFDVMIVSGIAAINWEALGGLILPLVLVCIAGTLCTFFYIRWICKKIYPEYSYEAFFAIFGMLTGTASTGMILLREIDPNFETPAADNLVLQQVPAIVFAAPLLLLLTFAGNGLTQSLIVFGIIVVMFIIYNIVLLRSYIFKKKARK